MVPVVFLWEISQPRLFIATGPADNPGRRTWQVQDLIGKMIISAL
jgi:hypothetical protein